MTWINPALNRRMMDIATRGLVDWINEHDGDPHLEIHWTTTEPERVRKYRWWPFAHETRRRTIRHVTKVMLKKEVGKDRISYLPVEPITWHEIGTLEDAVLVLPNGTELARGRPWNTSFVTPGASVDFAFGIDFPGVS